jgi:aerobic carbon-monoxide dehydrogenase medium subunit
MEYFEPNFLNEALVVLDRYGARAKVLAGGTLLGPQLREAPHAADALVNVKRISALSEIVFADGLLRIGALAPARTLAAHPLVKTHAPLVALAAASMGAPQLRSVATIGGNVLSAHHSADLATALLACDARAVVATLREGPHELAVEQMLSPGFCGLGHGALVTEIHVPSSGPRASCAFEKMQTRRAFEMALVSVAVQVAFEGDIVQHARIALGGAAPTPIRATGAETALAGAPIDDALAANAARIAAGVDAEPQDDHRASAAYRRHLVGVLVTRALLATFQDRRAGGA